MAEGYPLYKKIAWRFVRTFLVAFLVNLTSFLQTAPDQISTEIVKSAIMASLIAGITGLTRVIRDYIGQGDYNNPVYRSPI